MIIGKVGLKSNAGEGKIKPMVISLLGPSGAKCQVADFSLLVDPPAKKKGSLVLQTETKIDEIGFAEEGRIWGAGEYEVAGVKVRGVDVGSDKKILRTAYAVYFDNIRLGFLNSLSASLSQGVLDKLGEIDVLFINPELSSLSTKELAALIKKVEPSIIIPMTDKGAKVLLEELGQKATKEEKLTLRAKELSGEEGIKVVWLKSE
ncbi:MAG: MBL fold metallo-hydrolase [Candidatus Colwellbacteria bacterium]|nr:MBL fold metallo-hydrolase [Candidatus Colwellbacteria bacterium]